MVRQTVTVQLANGQSVQIRVDRDSGVPLHTQLFEQLKHFIGTRRIEQGRRLPSVRRLAAELDVAPVTVSRTYAELAARGIVEARQGSGVYVVDFAHVDAGDTEAVGQRLRDFAATVMAQASRLGYDADALADAIRAVGSTRPPRDPNLVVVIDEFDSVDPQVEQLSAALADDSVRVVGLRLDAVDANRDLINAAGTIASAPHCFGLVRRALPELQDEIVGLTMGLSADTTTALRQIDPTGHVVVVGTQPSFLSWMSYIVRLHVPLFGDPVEVAITDEMAVRRAVAAADVVVYGSGVRHRLPPLLPPEVEAIELRHVPDAESIANLRRRVRRAADPAGQASTLA